MLTVSCFLLISPFLWHGGPAYRQAHPTPRWHLRVHHLQRQRHQGPDCVWTAQTNMLFPSGPCHRPGTPSHRPDGVWCLCFSVTWTISVLLSLPWAPAPRPLLPPLLPPHSSLLVPMASSTGLQFLPITSSAPVPWFPLNLDQLVLVSTTVLVVIEAWAEKILVLQPVLLVWLWKTCVGAGTQLGMISKGSGSVCGSGTT